MTWVHSDATVLKGFCEPGARTDLSMDRIYDAQQRFDKGRAYQSRHNT